MYSEIIDKYRAQLTAPKRVMGYQRFARLVSEQAPAPITHMQLYRLSRGETKLDRPLYLYMAEHAEGWVGEMARELLNVNVDNN